MRGRGIKVKGVVLCIIVMGVEAKNGDKIVQLTYEGKIAQFGVLVDAVPGNDFCNGMLVPVHNVVNACICDCLHVDDVASMIAEKGLAQRPKK